MSEDKKYPRQWELLKVEDVQDLQMPATIVAIVGDDMELGERVNVIEREEYWALLAKLRIATKALSFYANEYNFMDGEDSCVIDTDIAKEALNEIKV